MGLLLVEITGRRTCMQTFDCKLVYILGKTVQGMVLESYFRQIASSQVVIVNFEINRHLFLVFLLLTLNIVFLAKYVVSKVT